MVMPDEIEGVTGVVGLLPNAGVFGAPVDAVHVFILDKALSKLLIYVEYCFMYAM